MKALTDLLYKEIFLLPQQEKLKLILLFLQPQQSTKRKKAYPEPTQKRRKNFMIMPPLIHDAGVAAFFETYSR